MKKIIIVIIGLGFLANSCLKENFENSFLYNVSWENNDSLFTVNSTKVLIFESKDDVRVKKMFKNYNLNLLISDSGALFENGNAILKKSIENNTIKIPIIASNKPGKYNVSMSVEGNDFIETLLKEFVVQDTVLIIPELKNVSLSSISATADNQSQINIELNNTDTLIGTKVKFELLGASGNLFANQSNSIERIVDVVNFKESFTVGATAGNYSVKVFIDEKEEEAVYLPFTLTSIAQDNLVLNTTINNVSNPFIADKESLVSLDLDIQNLTGTNTANVDLEILQNSSDALFVLNNSNELNTSIAASNPSSSLLIKAGQKSGVIIVKINFESLVYYVNIPVGISRPDVLNLLPNSYSINSSVSSQASGKVFHSKLNGKTSINQAIYLSASQNNVSVGTFDYPVFYTDSSNEILFNFTTSVALDTLQPLILKTYTYNDSNVQIMDSISLTVIP